MATVRQIVTDGVLSIKGEALGDDPIVDELNIGLSSFQQLLLEWHEALGPMTDVDISADYIAGANQRLRIQDGASVTITLPNSIPLFVSCDPFDYGFSASQFQPQQGSTSPAGPSSGFYTRQPRDGERVEIVGAGPLQALYFYVADLNNWASVYSLALDSVAPVNSRYVGHWGARLAERLLGYWPDSSVNPVLGKRIAMANAALLIRPGVERSPTRTDYF